MGNAELYDRIIASYKENGSVKKTAEELGTSVIKVRRVLITEGLWSSATRVIANYYFNGESNSNDCISWFSTPQEKT